MEDNTQNNKNFSESLINIIKKNINIIIIILFILFSSLIGISLFEHHKDNKNVKVSEKNIQAGLLLKKKKKKKNQILFIKKLYKAKINLIHYYH